MGVIGAPHNGFGVNGIAPNIRYMLASVCRPHDAIWAGVIGTFSNEDAGGRVDGAIVAHAMLDAARDLRLGDVLLIEMHSPGPDTGAECQSNCDQFEYVPMEYYQESFDVIRRLTARGIIVVEAAGNGGVDLDRPVFQGRFNPRVRHSGALLVAAARDDGEGNVPAGFSNTTDRMDLYSWGGGVVTIGYGGSARDGPPFYGTERRRFYTPGFSGTSSASAIVAGAVASLQGICRGSGRPPLTPPQMRDILFASGTRQRNTSPAGAFIGRQPNLRLAGPMAVAATRNPVAVAVPGDFMIRVRSSGKVLDIDTSWFGGNNDGQPLLQWDWHGGRNQQFRLTRVSSGTFTIQPLHSLKCLEVADASRANRAPIRQAACNGRRHQHFRIEGVGSASFRIVAVHSGKVLDVLGDGRGNGARLIQFRSTGRSNQRFELIPAG